MLMMSIASWARVQSRYFFDYLWTIRVFDTGNKNPSWMLCSKNEIVTILQHTSKIEILGLIISSGNRHGFRWCVCVFFHFLYPNAAFRKSFTILGPNEWVTLLTSHGGKVPCGSQWAMYPTRQPPFRCCRITNPVICETALKQTKSKILISPWN